MVNMPQKKIKEHLDINELENIIKNIKTNCQQYKKFAVIRAVAKGRMVSEICDDLCISEPTGHRWVDLL
jgi:DNA-binding NarL/FixJ family response regulator